MNFVVCDQWYRNCTLGKEKTLSTLDYFHYSVRSRVFTLTSTFDKFTCTHNTDLGNTVLKLVFASIRETMWTDLEIRIAGMFMVSGKKSRQKLSFILHASACA